MIVLNLRAADSTIVFSALPHWSVPDGEDLSVSEVRERLRGKRVLVLIHGYNVEDALDAYARMEVNLSERNIQYDEIIGVTWPGSKVMLAFLLAKVRANKAGKKLAQALNILSGVACLDIEGHSLGCRVACEAVANGLTPRMLILAGAAIDSDSILQGTDYGQAIEDVPAVLVAYSREDSVLRRAYTIAEWENALGLTGPSDKMQCGENVHCVDLSDYVPSHSYYKKSDEFYLAWKSVMLKVEGEE